jgi:hypothetical protein
MNAVTRGVTEVLNIISASTGLAYFLAGSMRFGYNITNSDADFIVYFPPGNKDSLIKDFEDMGFLGNSKIIILTMMISFLTTGT